MNVKITVLTVLSIILAGCHSYNKAGLTKLSSPIPHQPLGEESGYELSPQAGGIYSASLGDTLFAVHFYRIMEEAITISPPVDLKPFPQPSSWSITHSLNEYFVYTSPEYYSGEVGIVAFRDGKLPMKPELIQVVGVKTGRRWPTDKPTSDLLFARRRVGGPSWAVRYGGHKSGVTEVQIYDKKDASVSEVVQNLLILDQDLQQGVVIKGVMIKTDAPQERGIIKYTIEDVAVSTKK